MKIHRIVNSVFHSNTYILDNDEEGIWLIDCGDIEPILQYVNTHKKFIKGICLTHVHYDHFYGIPTILNLFPNCQIYTSKEGVEALASEKINFSKYHDDPIAISKPNIHFIEDGETLVLWKNGLLKAIATPGHDYSCMCYIINSFIFTGDSFIPGLKVIASFPRSNKEDALNSEKILKQLINNDGLIVKSGHTV